MKEWQEMSMAILKPSDELSSERALQVLLEREGDRVQGDVEPAPGLGDAIEHRLELTLFADITRDNDGRPEIACEGLHVGLRLLVQVGDGQFRPEGAEHLGAAVGDRMLVGDAEHQGALAEKRLAFGHVGHG